MDNTFAINTNQLEGIITIPKRPIPIDKEILLDPSKTIMSKTDAKGKILYANDYFMEVSGYEEYELMGQAHNVIRHPDMPRVIFKMLWDRLKEGKNIHCFVKNLSKDGRYYWVITNFETKYDAEGNILYHYSRRKAAPRNAVYEVDKFYKTLRNIEYKSGMQTALGFIEGMLEEKNITFDELTLSYLNSTSENLEKYLLDKILTKEMPERKKGFFEKIFL